MLASGDAASGEGKLRNTLGGVALGLFVAGIGAFFVFALWVAFDRARETRSWIETACEILKSEVGEGRPTPNSPLSYRAVVEYRYHFGGQPRTGYRVKRVDGPSGHRKKIEAVVEKYPVGRQLSCWVNPADPDEAILKHSTLAPLYTIWFPGLFVVAGLGIAINSLRRTPR